MNAPLCRTFGRTSMTKGHASEKSLVGISIGSELTRVDGVDDTRYHMTALDQIKNVLLALEPQYLSILTLTKR